MESFSHSRYLYFCTFHMVKVKMFHVISSFPISLSPEIQLDLQVDNPHREHLATNLWNMIFHKSSSTCCHLGEVCGLTWIISLNPLCLAAFFGVVFQENRQRVTVTWGKINNQRLTLIFPLIWIIRNLGIYVWI